MKKLILIFGFLTIFVKIVFADDFRGDLMNESQNAVKIAFDKAVTAGKNIKGSNFSGSVCYHVPFNSVDVSNSNFAYSNVMRFCNFKQSIANNTIFEGFLLSQTFENTSLKNSTFINSARSSITFKNCNLKGARFINYNMKDIRFENSSVVGVQINGKMCTTNSIEDCIAQMIPTNE